MADNKSSEGKVGRGLKAKADYLFERFGSDAKKNDITSDCGVRAESVSGVTIDFDVDVSSLLTGLKAIQREAKKATAALKELEEQQKHTADIAEGIR